MTTTQITTTLDLSNEFVSVSITRPRRSTGPGPTIMLDLYTDEADALRSSLDSTMSTFRSGYQDPADRAKDAYMVNAHYVLHEFGPGPPGRFIPPGDFTTLLLKAASHADDDNLNRLAAAFPILIGAFMTWRREGPEPLIVIAEGGHRD